MSHALMTEALRRHFEIAPDLAAELLRFEKEWPRDLAPLSGGAFAPGDLAQIAERAAHELRSHLDSKALTFESLRQQWPTVVRDFHAQKQWGFRAAPPTTFLEKQRPEVREMWPYIWAFVQTGFIMKIFIYYFGLESSSDPTLTNRLFLYGGLAFSAGSLTFFAWRMFRREALAARKDPVESKTEKPNLTPLQESVCFHDGTEPPFQNEYWNEKRAGLYVDRVSGEPLFSSLDKYDSGTGWPSFTKPVEKDRVTERQDFKMHVARTEVRSKKADIHLGHVFPDGPGPDGMRYCMNSAALRFIPAEDLEREGYGAYAALFAKTE